MCEVINDMLLESKNAGRVEERQVIAKKMFESYMSEDIIYLATGIKKEDLK